MVQRAAEGQDPDLTFHQTNSTSHTLLANSPAVSKERKSQKMLQIAREVTPGGDDRDKWRWGNT